MPRCGAGSDCLRCVWLIPVGMTRGRGFWTAILTCIGHNESVVSGVPFWKLVVCAKQSIGFFITGITMANKVICRSDGFCEVMGTQKR